MKPSKLPESLGVVAGPTHYTPSRVCMEGCALRVVASSSGVKALPAGPAAALGTILHKLLENAQTGRIADTGDGAVADVRREFDALVVEGESRLPAHWVPLKRMFGWAEWRARTQPVLSRAAEVVASASRSDMPSDAHEHFIVQAPVGEIHSEFTLVSDRWPLRGNVDLLYVEPDVVTVTDFKTGKVEDENGVMAHIRHQLELYGLLAAENFPGKRIVLRVVKDRSWEWEFDEARRRDAVAFLRERLAELPPPSQMMDAAAAATLGDDCRRCGFRHVCPAYLDAAPKWWVETPVHAIPSDVWGTVFGVEEHDGIRDVVLQDAAGRRVRIFGLRPHHGEIEVGQTLFFFGLERDPPRFGDPYKHPQNFYDMRVDAASAHVLTVFEGPTL